MESPDALNRLSVRLSGDYNYTTGSAGEIRVCDKSTGEAYFIVDAPLAWDSSGNAEETCPAVNLETCSGYTRLTYKFEEGFLNKAVFPITIDPIVRTLQTKTNVVDTYLRSVSPNSTFGTSGKLLAGKGGNTSGLYVSLIRFERLVKQRACDTIISARLRMFTDTYQGGARYFGAYEVMKDWTESSTWNSFAPETPGNISSELLSFVNKTNWSDHICWFDLTDLYRSWYSNSVSRGRGIALRRTHGNTAQDYVEW